MDRRLTRPPFFLFGALADDVRLTSVPALRKKAYGTNISHLEAGAYWASIGRDECPRRTHRHHSEYRRRLGLRATVAGRLVSRLSGGVVRGPDMGPEREHADKLAAPFAAKILTRRACSAQTVPSCLNRNANAHAFI